MQSLPCYTAAPTIIEVTKMKDTPIQCNAAMLLKMFILKGYKPQPSNFNIEQITHDKNSDL
jgi:hypothetical protein